MVNFDKSKRLTRDLDFKATFADGKKLLSHFFIILYKTNKLPYNRLGLIITKKKIPLAHARNRVRRLIREVFRISFQNNNTKYDIIIMAKYNITSEANKDIMTDLKNNLNKL